MATLSQATQTTRTVLRWAGILFGIFLIVRLVIFPLGMAIYDRLFPNEPPPPTVAFGTLPKIKFPSSSLQSTGSYALATTTGDVPPTCVYDACLENSDPTKPVNIPDRLTVYKVLREPASFSSYDRARDRVKSLGFTNEGIALSDIKYQWRHARIENREITLNILTNSFSLTTPIASPSAETPKVKLPQKDEALRIIKSFLSSLKLLPKDIDDGKTEITFLKFTNGQLKKTTSLSEADIVQVDLYRKPLSTLPIMHPDPSQSLMSFRLQGERNPDIAVTVAQFSYKAVDETDKDHVSTYPIKTAQEALEELKGGKAYIASGATTRNGQIDIHKIYIAYYEDDKPDQFLQPVFVFEGEGNFLAYVSAITDQWLE